MSDYECHSYNSSDAMDASYLILACWCYKLIQRMVQRKTAQEATCWKYIYYNRHYILISTIKSRSVIECIRRMYDTLTKVNSLYFPFIQVLSMNQCHTQCFIFQALFAIINYHQLYCIVITESPEYCITHFN